MGVLNDIIEKKKQRLSDVRGKISLAELKSIIADAPETRQFTEALTRGEDERIRVIAEIKRASPSTGLIRPDFDPVAIARIYEKKGATAVSLLTEEDFFRGSLKYVPLVKEAISLPVLRKDFIIDEYQIYEARAHQADAILLIGAVLGKGQAAEYLHMADETGLSVLYEIHNRVELDTALMIDAPIIGINNRDLDTLKIDLTTTMKLMKSIPVEKIIVAESGISRREEVELYERTRVSALLIGSALLKEADIGRKYDELFH